MTALLFSLGAAVVLMLALTLFLRAREGANPPNTSQEPAVRELPAPSRLNAAAINEAIFSRRDWEFIRRERCSSLESLFLSERKAVASYWLTVTQLRVSTIRKTHLLNSRLSRDLSPGQEFRLLLQFLYLSVVCRVGLLVIQVAGPMAPADLAAHIQRLADSLPTVPEGRFSRVHEN
jgi:hypothetical protein